SYAVTESTRGGGDSENENAAIQAAQIIQLMNRYSVAVRRLIFRGCDPSEISFYESPNWTAANGNSPSDGSCHVFGENGAGEAYASVDEKALDTRYAGEYGYATLRFLRANNVFGMAIDGGSSRTVHVSILYVSDAVCLEINKKLHGVAAIPTDTDNTYQSNIGFTGAFSSGNTVRCENNPFGASDCVQEVGCFKVSDFTPATTISGGNIAIQALMRQSGI
ncbi:MAG: hypothetical protein ACPG05_02650, partial [Bdellovibrionales bacterium]